MLTSVEYPEVTDCIASITTKGADIYRSHDNKYVVSFDKVLPTDEEVIRLKEALKEFGAVLLNSCREKGFVEFLLY